MFAIGTRLVAAVVLAGQGAVTPATELRAKFERHLSELAAAVDGVVGYTVVDLTSGERIGHLERQTFPTASTIKIAILYELLRQVDEGKINLYKGAGLSESSRTDALSLLNNTSAGWARAWSTDGKWDTERSDGRKWPDELIGWHRLCLENHGINDRRRISEAL
jgi:hypothetical protein